MPRRSTADRSLWIWACRVFSVICAPSTDSPDGRGDRDRRREQDQVQQLSAAGVAERTGNRQLEEKSCTGQSCISPWIKITSFIGSETEMYRNCSNLPSGTWFACCRTCPHAQVNQEGINRCGRARVKRRHGFHVCCSVSCGGDL
jgi:hypothetical protein